MKKPRLPKPPEGLLFIALSISIPAFYLVLTGPTQSYRSMGYLLYAISAMLMAADIGMQWRRPGRTGKLWQKSSVDIMILGGALASAWPTAPHWPLIEWVLRLGFCGIVFFRLTMLLANWLAPHHLLQVLGISAILLAIAGGGFYWLEPTVLTYADGLWLAFTTGATVGYGDLVPSTPAARIFAIFIVLLGYAVFSVVTASISALFIGAEEKRFEKELHADIRALRNDITALREELYRSSTLKK